MAVAYATGMVKSPTTSKSIALGLVRAARGRESVDGAKGRQGWASVVKKLKVYVRSAKVCVTGNALLSVEPRDGTLEEFGLLVIASLRLELCGRRSVSWLWHGFCLPSPARKTKRKTYLSDPHGAITSNAAHVGDEGFEVVQKRARVVLPKKKI